MDEQRKIKVERRKIYSDFIRNRNRINVRPILTTPTYIPPTYIPPTYTYVPQTYTDLPQTYDSQGLINKNLFRNSCITKSKLDEFCVICQDTINKHDIIRQLICLHNFHIECVDEWLLEKCICPLCKQTLI